MDFAICGHGALLKGFGSPSDNSLNLLGRPHAAETEYTVEGGDHGIGIDGRQVKGRPQDCVEKSCPAAPNNERSPAGKDHHQSITYVRHDNLKGCVKRYR